MVGRLPEGIIQEIKSQRHNFNQCDSHLTGTTYLAFTSHHKAIGKKMTLFIIEITDPIIELAGKENEKTKK